MGKVEGKRKGEGLCCLKTRCNGLTSSWTAVLLLLLLVLLAHASTAASVSKPVLKSTFTLSGDSSRFVRVRGDSLTAASLTPLILLTEQSLISLSETAAPAVTAIPSKFSPLVALMEPGYLWILPVSPANVLYRVPCGASDAADGGGAYTCSWHSGSVLTIALPDGNYTDLASSQPYIAACSGASLVLVKCEGSCKVSSHTSIAHSHYPVLGSIVTLEVGVPLQFFVTLLASDAPDAVGVLLCMHILNLTDWITVYLPSSPVITFATETPGYGRPGSTSYTSDSTYTSSGYDASTGGGVLYEFGMERPPTMTPLPFQFADASELFVASGFAQILFGPNYDTRLFVSTALPSAPANASLYAYSLGWGLASQAVPLPVPALVSAIVAAVNDQLLFFSWVGAQDPSGGDSFVLEYQTVFSEGAPPARRAPLEGSVSQSLGSMPSPPSPACQDRTQPPTCLTSCQPLPSMICGPTLPPPDGYSCFVMRTQMDACNYCPAAWSNTCNSATA